MAQRLSPDRRQGDFPGRNRGPKATPAEPLRSDRGPAVPPLGAAGVGGARSRRERGAFGGSMGTMGPVSAEPGLSLWDAMSVRGARRGRTHRSLGNPPRSAGRAHRDTPSARPAPRRSGGPPPPPQPSFFRGIKHQMGKAQRDAEGDGGTGEAPPGPRTAHEGTPPEPPKGEPAGGARQPPPPLLRPARGSHAGPRSHRPPSHRGGTAGLTGLAQTHGGGRRARSPRWGYGRWRGGQPRAGTGGCEQRGGGPPGARPAGGHGPLTWESLCSWSPLMPEARAAGRSGRSGGQRSAGRNGTRGAQRGCVTD